MPHSAPPKEGFSALFRRFRVMRILKRPPRDMVRGQNEAAPSRDCGSWLPTPVTSRWWRCVSSRERSSANKTFNGSASADRVGEACRQGPLPLPPRGFRGVVLLFIFRTQTRQAAAAVPAGPRLQRRHCVATMQPTGRPLRRPTKQPAVLGESRPTGGIQVVSQNERSPTGPVGPDLLGQLIDQHAVALELYAGGWCDSPEDVLQEVLIELAGRRTLPEHLVAWLYRAVRYRAINARRARERRRRHEREAARRRPSVLVGPPAEMLDCQSATAALDDLPNELREVIVAYLWGGLTFRQIGQLTGTSESTAQRRYRTALQRIRKTMSRQSCTNES